MLILHRAIARLYWKRTVTVPLGEVPLTGSGSVEDLHSDAATVRLACALSIEQFPDLWGFRKRATRTEPGRSIFPEAPYFAHNRRRLNFRMGDDPDTIHPQVRETVTS